MNLVSVAFSFFWYLNIMTYDEAPTTANIRDSVHKTILVMEKGSSSRFTSAFLTFSKNLAVLILYRDCMQVDEESQKRIEPSCKTKV